MESALLIGRRITWRPDYQAIYLEAILHREPFSSGGASLGVPSAILIGRRITWRPDVAIRCWRDEVRGARWGLEYTDLLRDIWASELTPKFKRLPPFEGCRVPRLCNLPRLGSSRMWCLRMSCLIIVTHVNNSSKTCSRNRDNN